MPRMWGRHQSTRIANFAMRNGAWIMERMPGPEWPARSNRIEPMPGPVGPWGRPGPESPLVQHERDAYKGHPNPPGPLEPHPRVLTVDSSGSGTGDSLIHESSSTNPGIIETQSFVVDVGSEYLSAQKPGGDIILSHQVEDL